MAKGDAKLTMTGPGKGLTPMMEQYNELKTRHPDALLMVRLGDFYELFNEDAMTASKELGLYLTGREIGSGNRMPMCGVPHHAIDEYLPQLVKKGYKVAIAEQLEDPKLVKGLVKRDIIRVVSPGVLEGEDGGNNFMAAVHIHDGAIGIAYCDASTGEFRATQLDGKDATIRAIQELERLSPSEVIRAAGSPLPHGLEELLASGPKSAPVTERPAHEFDARQAAKTLAAHFGSAGVEGFGLVGMPSATAAAGALLTYLGFTQKSDLGHITSLGAYRISGFMHIDRASWRNLAVFGNERAEGGKGLLGVMDRTSTKMGARLIRAWLEAPLVDAFEISRRQDAVCELIKDRAEAERMEAALSGILDLERLGSKLAYSSAMPRDLAALSRSLKGVGMLKKAIEADAKAPLLRELGDSIDPAEDLTAELDAALADELPADMGSGGFIKHGYDAEVDELRSAAAGGRDWLAGLEASERERTGIKNLRIGYNSVFGYYFEVSKSNIANVPSDFIRKQTLAGSERYYTEQLKEIETKVLGAEEKQVKLEQQIFKQLVEMASRMLDGIMRSAAAAAAADVLASFARAAFERRWVRPEVDGGLDTLLYDAKHPVMEAVMPAGRFVENDIELKHDDARLLILTGPNMAGKSTVLATVGLIQLMAQAGSYVPCSSAKIGLADRIYYRAGSYDDIAVGKSTFMVELLEVAEILNTSTESSLVMVDELGRGTSTYDGMALAWAVAEHIHDVTRSRCLFTTHYHELAELEEKLPFARNYHVSVAERADEVVFLYKLQRGGTDKSYGINVARMAGLPKDVIRRAGQILRQLEKIYDRGGHQMKLFGWGELPEAADDGPLPEKVESKAMELLKGADPEALSPREALDLVFEMKKALEEEEV